MEPTFGKGIAMKKMLTVLAATFALAAFENTASAQGLAMPGMVPSYVSPPEQPAGIEKQYGLHPGLKRLFPAPKDCGCGVGSRIGGKIHAAFAKLKAETPPAPPPNGGTLAFPNHTFVRSPRDFFMQDQ
jgi:hypothetical protein